MKRLCVCAICLVLLFSLSACYGTTRSVATTEPPTTASAGLTYMVNADGKTCTVTGIGSCTDTDLHIGEEIDGYTVTGVEAYAFADCVQLTSVILPDALIHLGTSAFRGCTGLQSVTLSKHLKYIEDKTFSGCESLTEISFVSGIREIGTSAFYGCKRLADLSLPQELKRIGDLAFYGCESLTDVTIPEGVTEIGNNAFRNCKALKTLTVAEGTKAIGNRAFAGCPALLTLSLPTTLTEIGEGAFEDSYITTATLPTLALPYVLKESLQELTISAGEFVTSTSITEHCENLSKITIGKDVRHLTGYDLYGCVSLAEIAVDPDNPVYHAVNNCLIETETKTLIVGCKNSRIPSDGSVTSIGNAAFARRQGLRSIHIPDCITDIGESAFFLCDTLESVYISAGVTCIRDSTFANCQRLASVLIPNGVRSIEKNAFGQKKYNQGISVFFYGTAEEWSQINIYGGSSMFTYDRIYYYSQTQPTDDMYDPYRHNDYWYYDNNIIRVWQAPKFS